MGISALKLAGHLEACENLQPLQEGTGVARVWGSTTWEGRPPYLDFGSPSVRVKMSAVFLVGII